MSLVQASGERWGRTGVKCNWVRNTPIWQSCHSQNVGVVVGDAKLNRMMDSTQYMFATLMGRQFKATHSQVAGSEGSCPISGESEGLPTDMVRYLRPLKRESGFVCPWCFMIHEEKNKELFPQRQRAGILSLSLSLSLSLMASNVLVILRVS